MERGEQPDERHIVRRDVREGDGTVLAADGSVFTTIIETVAATSNTPATELPPLYDTVDTDALERLFAPKHDGTGRQATVTFSYYGHEVTVRDGRTVGVRPLDD